MGESKKEKKPLPSAAEDAIGRQLKAIYDEVAEEPVPDRFLELLQKLDEKQE